MKSTVELSTRGEAYDQFPDFAGVAAHVRDRCAALGKPYGYAYAATFDRLLIPR